MTAPTISIVRQLRKLETFTACIWGRDRLQSPCLRETNSDKEVGKMYFFNCDTNCCTNCSAIWQILSRICGFGC